MESLRTKPINANVQFLRISAAIDAVLAPSGYRRKSQEGSHSWLGTSRSGRNNETIFKLCFYGPDHIRFGVRQDFLADFDALRGLPWPLEFAVAPQNEVAFLGFRVDDNPTSAARITRVFTAMNLATTRDPQDYEVRERRFDEQLGQL